MSVLHEDAAELFKGRHFNHEIITLCVRWYLTYKLSYRDLVEMMAERHVEMAHTTIMRWVQGYVPEFAKCWLRYAKPVGTSWRVDETYIKIRQMGLSVSGYPARQTPCADASLCK